MEWGPWLEGYTWMVVGLPLKRWAFEMWVGQYERENLNPLGRLEAGKRPTD